MFVRYIAVLVIIAASLGYCFDNGPDRDPRRPVCKECRDLELMVAPGIGFDLTHSYGTASVRFQNGSVVFIGRVEGDRDFTWLMLEKARDSPRPKEPETPWEKLQDALEHARRRLSKSRGLPATKDVGTIASVIIELRNITEKHLHQKINAAVATIPRLPSLTSEDLEDAMEYAGLKMLRGYNFQGDVDHVQAVYAALGNGLCHSPEDIKSCEDEEASMKSYAVLSVTFTDWFLSLRMSSCRAAHECVHFSSEENRGLGLRNAGHGPAVEYWMLVRRRIRRFAEQFWTIDKLQVFGEAAANEQFLDVLRDALKDLEPRLAVDVGGTEGTEPLSLASRGAAELAKRFQVMTWGCQEPGRCSDTETVEESWVDL